MGGETGEKISDDYPIDKHLTVYVVTNYAKFNIDSTKTKIELTSDGKGYTGVAPKGKIIIPDGITEIEGTDYWTRGAFYGCAEITSVQLPQSLTTIGSRAFEDCTGLTSIRLPARLTEIGSQAFRGCTGLTSIHLPANLTEIGSRAFWGCTGLKSLDLSACASLTTIDGNAFYGCTSLTSISLPASLTTIGDWAFAGCTGLTSIGLPAKLTGIGWHAFWGCTGLTSAVFADKEGWKVYDNDSYSGTPTSISSSDLADPATAAKYLRERSSYVGGGYCEKYWKKN